MAANRLAVHDSVLRTAFVREMREWRPGVADQRDDGLDAVAGCLLAEPVRLPRLMGDTPLDNGGRPWRGDPTLQIDPDFVP
jgi:hypothetical protein